MKYGSSKYDQWLCGSDHLPVFMFNLHIIYLDLYNMDLQHMELLHMFNDSLMDLHDNILNCIICLMLKWTYMTRY